MTTKIVHHMPLRESAAIVVEVLDDGRIRLGLWRSSPASTDPDDATLVSGFAISHSDARELRAALQLAIVQVEADVA